MTWYCPNCQHKLVKLMVSPSGDDAVYECAPCETLYADEQILDMPELFTHESREPLP